MEFLRGGIYTEATVMAASKDFYFARNKDGYVCAYDSKTHKCVDIMFLRAMILIITNSIRKNGSGRLTLNMKTVNKSLY